MAGNRCDSCSKMVSMEFEDPEEESFEADVSMDAETGNLIGEITATVRISRSCAECGSEMKEATLEMSHSGDDIILDVDLLTGTLFPESVAHIRRNDETKKHEWLEGHGLKEIEHDDPEQVETSTGKGRGLKTFFGASIAWRVDCECGECLVDGTLEDNVAASAMDEL